MIDFSGDVLYDRVRYAGMAELADAQDLGSCEAIRVGSTPTTRTTSEQAAYRLLRRFFTAAPRLCRGIFFCDRTGYLRKRDTAGQAGETMENQRRGAGNGWKQGGKVQF